MKKKSIIALLLAIILAFTPVLALAAASPSGTTLMTRKTYFEPRYNFSFMQELPTEEKLAFALPILHDVFGDEYTLTEALYVNISLRSHWVYFTSQQLTFGNDYFFIFTNDDNTYYVIPDVVNRNKIPFLRMYFRDVDYGIYNAYLFTGTVE